MGAISVSYRSIDAAQGYFKEEGAGEAISECGVPRCKLFLTTKIWIFNGGYEKARASRMVSAYRLLAAYLLLV